MLQSAAELIPVPLLKDALGVAIKIIEVCEVSTSVLEYSANAKQAERTLTRTLQLSKRRSGNCRKGLKRS